MVTKRDCDSGDKSIFDILAYAVGCDYISDLRFDPYNAIARRAVSEMNDFGSVPLKTLSDLYNYLYAIKVDFSTYEEAARAFGQTKSAPSEGL